MLGRNVSRWGRGWPGIVTVVPVRAFPDPGLSAPPIGTGLDASPDPPPPEPGRHQLRWWIEVVIVVSFYGIYTAVRNQFGSNQSESVRQAAIDNAAEVIAAERALGLYVEKGVQDLFIGWDPFIVFWNVFYGTLHFGVTIAVMVFLFVRHPARYGRWRTVLGATTALALVGFLLYPLMPPRLLNDCGEYGACDPRLRVRGHAGGPGRALVVRVVGHGGDLQPVRGHAQPARGLGHLVRPGRGARGPPALDPLGPSLLPGAHRVLGRGDGQPLLIDAAGAALAVAGGWLVGSRLHRHMPGWLAPAARPAPMARLEPCR